MDYSVHILNKYSFMLCHCPCLSLRVSSNLKKLDSVDVIPDNKINIEIAERIAKGNKAYYANAKLIKSKLLTKNNKMKVYKTMIRPVVTYSSETLKLTAKNENNLRSFERQILRKIFGPVSTDNM